MLVEAFVDTLGAVGILQGAIQSGNAGNSSSKKTQDKIDKAVENVPNKYKKYGKCDFFAEELAKNLDKENIDYEIIRIDTKIENLSVNSSTYEGVGAFHYGIRIGDIMYDNFNPNGIDAVKWFDDYGLLKNSNYNEFQFFEIVNEILHY